MTKRLPSFIRERGEKRLQQVVEYLGGGGIPLSVQDVISERDQGNFHLSRKRLSPVVLSLFGSGPGEGSNASFIDFDGFGDADLRGGIISGYSPRAGSGLWPIKTRFPRPRISSWLTKE